MFTVEKLFQVTCIYTENNWINIEVRGKYQFSQSSNLLLHGPNIVYFVLTRIVLSISSCVPTNYRG